MNNKIYSKDECVEIELMMVGDMLMHDNVLKSGLSANGIYHFDHLFKHIRSDIQNADIRIVNQETILAGEELGISDYPFFNSPFALGDAEASAGFNVILHATNHALDKGLEGIERCCDYWSMAHPEVAVLGINRTEDDYNRIYVYEKSGFRVAILNYTFESNVMPIPQNKPYCLNLFDRKKMMADIETAKQSADMVVVCPHWGTEYIYSTDADQREWMNFFLSAGVDVVIGTHPHVLEPVEMLCSPEGRNMLVYYSLGNFISDQSQMPRDIGGMAKITLVKDKNGFSISKYSLIPIVTHREFGYGRYSSYKLSDYTDNLANRNNIKTVNGFNKFSVRYISDLCSYILGDDFHADKGILSICDISHHYRYTEKAERKAIIVECISSGVNYISDLREMGIEPVLLEIWCPQEQEQGERDYYDKEYSLNGDSLPEIIKADKEYEVTLDTVRRIKPILIIPGTDSGIELAMRLSHDLGLPGNSIDIFPNMRDKYLMQMAIKKAGLRCIDTEIIANPEDALKFFSDLNSKEVVIKRTRGAASVGVTVCRSEEEITQAVKKNIALAKKKNNGSKVIVQEYISGTEYAIDTISCNGKHRTVSGLKYVKRITEDGHRIYDYDEYIDTGAAEYRYLSDYVFSVLDAIGITVGPVHTEIMVDENEPVLIEVNCRPAGKKIRREFLDRVTGCHETKEALYAYLRPDTFDLCQRICGKYGNRKLYGVVKQIIIPRDIFVKKLLFDESFGKLNSFCYYLSYGENRVYKRTVDLDTIGGMIYLCSDEEEELKADLKTIEYWEKESLNVLMDYTEID